MHAQIAADRRLYTVVHDLTTYYRLLVAGRVLDALTGEPVRSTFTVTAEREDLLVRSLDDGFFAVGGDPELAFSLLASNAYPFGLTVSAPGYREASQTVPVPANATFPRPPVVFSLRRRPVRLQGRVTEAAGAQGPIPGAAVGIGAGPVLALRTPLAFGHDAGVEVRDCALTSAGAPKLLHSAAAGGDDTLTLNNRTGLNLGHVLRLGPPEAYEYAPITGLAPEPADLNQPGEVTLGTPLRRSLSPGDEAQRVNPAPNPAAEPLAARAEVGEGVLRLSNPLAAATVRVELLASPEVEYHAVGALSDAEGFYRFDGIAGIVEATFVASAAGFNDGDQPWVIDYPTPVNVLDFRLEAP